MIGIITYFYNSTNYGGILQAYALCKALNTRGIKAQQIMYDYNSNIPFRLRHSFIKRIKRHIFEIIKRVTQKNTNSLKSNNFKEFVATFIPHSDKVFNQSNIKKCIKDYNCFICGSDQIWNPISMDDIFFLCFVKDKKKIAYAASVGVDSLSSYEIYEIANRVSDYSWISVRERTIMSALKKKVHCLCQFVVDPVFLINREEWHNTFCKDSSKKFVFTYFLSSSEEKKTRARKIIGEREVHDFSPKIQDGLSNNYFFMGECGPDIFLSSLFNSEIVLTDSFHAFAFSILFNKEMVVFPREDSHSITRTGRRITDFIDAMNIPYSFFENVMYINPNLDEWSMINKKVDKWSEESLSGLIKAIKS